MEGDTLDFPVKIENVSGKDITGSVSLSFEDASNGASLDAAFENSITSKNFKLKAGRSETLYWKIKAPRAAAPVKYTARAVAGSYDDGEEGMLPVISSRVLVRESFPFTLNGPGEKKEVVDKIKYMASVPEIQDSCELTMRAVSNPSWYAFLAFPYLMEFPHECCEQVFNRLYAAAMASFLLEKNPGIKNNIELLQKFPGVPSQGRLSTIGALAGYFDKKSLELRVKSAYSKLSEAAVTDNMWPWFQGGRANIDITLYIISGFGRLKKMGVADINYTPAVRALAAADSWVENTPYSGSNAAQSCEISLKQAAYYLYARSFYIKNMPLMGMPSGRMKFLIDSLKKSWENIESRLTLAHLATAFSRYGETETARKIMLHLKEMSSKGADGEMFWTERAGLYRGGLDGDIEAQAAAIEGFLEAAEDPESAGMCAAWLINLKRAIHWPTTVATADAIYAISLCGENMLKSSCTAEIFIGGEMVAPDTVEAGSGYFEKSYSGRSVKPVFSEILFRTREKGIAWGSAHLDYYDDVSRATGDGGGALKIKRTIRSVRDGSILQAGSVINIGDELSVVIEIDSDRELDYVHVYDPRGCGFEPVDNISKYVNGYHFSPRDQGARFYIERLAKGRSVIEHKLKACHGGKFNFAPVSVECMYAPEFIAHSASVFLCVK